MRRERGDKERVDGDPGSGPSRAPPTPVATGIAVTASMPQRSASLCSARVRGATPGCEVRTSARMSTPSASLASFSSSLARAAWPHQGQAQSQRRWGHAARTPARAGGTRTSS